MSQTDAARPWEVQRRGLLLLISSPSGAGKTSLSRRLVADHDDLVVALVGNDLDLSGDVLIESAADLLVHLGHALRRLDDPGAVEILTDPLENQPDTGGDLLQVHFSCFSHADHYG